MHRGEHIVASADGQKDFWQPVDDWTQLQGRQVEIHRGGSISDSGRVEAVTGDGAILWLAHDGAVTRRLILKQDGLDVKLPMTREA